MIIKYKGASNIKNSLVAIEGVTGVTSGEMAEISLDSGAVRKGRVIQVDGDRVIIQVFEGTHQMSLENIQTRFTGEPIKISVSPEILGRVFNGLGDPLDGLGVVYGSEKRDINGEQMNPVSRIYPRNCVVTGISSIDILSTLIRGQKLPIFSGYGMKHNEIAAQIVRQAKLFESSDKNDFAIVFAAMGVKNDVAYYFKNQFEQSGVFGKVVMFLNVSSDPVIERILTPRFALTAAEYLAFELDMHILVIMTDITAYAEALREFSSSKNEIPGRKGYPGYLYSDLSSLYERAGMLKGKKGSVTQIPILTMPDDDITHPVPDLTGYITEGQIVLDRTLERKGCYPAISILPSLSRLMKDGIGENYTRKDHPYLANQLLASYAKVQDVRSLSSVIGEDDLNEIDKLYLKFGQIFENKFINQNINEERTINESLDLGWKILSILPKKLLDRVDKKIIDEYYIENKEEIDFFIKLDLNSNDT